jgi:hypothetical protein
LSPISARKKVTRVAVNAPARLIALPSPAYLSGNSAHTATLRKEIPRIQRIHGPVIKRPKNVPTRPAAARFASVAKKMPKMIGSGRWKRAASIKDRI